MKFLFLSLVFLCLSACTASTDGNKSRVTAQQNQELEDQRKVARENAEKLAMSYRADNKLTDYEISGRGDSTQAIDCPQGDGWASVDLVKRSSGERIKLKCSTYSEGIGCLEDSDFKTKRYAKEDGSCNVNVPSPLPKVSK